MSTMRSPRGTNRSGSPSRAAVADDDDGGQQAFLTSPQRVIFVGASGSGKSAIRDVVYNRHAGDSSTSGSSTTGGTSAAAGARIPDVRSSGTAHKARSGRCQASRYPLRATVERPALDDRPSSRHLGAKSRDDDTASIAASQANRTTLVMVEMAEASVGADCLLPLQLLELRDDDVGRMLTDKVLAHEALPAYTSSIVITVDATTLFPPAPSLPRPDIDLLIKTLAMQNVAAVTSSTGSNSSDSNQASQANFGSPAPVAPPTPIAPRRGATSVASSGAATTLSYDDPKKAILLLPDQVLLDAYKQLQRQDSNDHSAAEYKNAVTLCRRTVECIKRYHPCPPNVNVVLALTKVDQLQAVFEARQIVAEEAARLGEALLRRKRDAETAAAAANPEATLVVKALRNAGGLARVARPVSMMKQDDAEDAMRVALRALVKRLLTDVEGLASPSAVSNTSLFAAPEHSHDSRASRDTATTSRLVPSYQLPPVAIALTSTVTNAGDSVQHLMNCLTAPPLVVDEKLRRLLDNVRRTCKMHCAALVDLNSLQFLSADSISQLHMPNAHLMQRKSTALRLKTRDDVNGVHAAEEANLSHPWDGASQSAMEGLLFGSVVGTPASTGPLAQVPPSSVTPAPTKMDRRTTFALPETTGGGGGRSPQLVGPACRKGIFQPAIWRDALRLMIQCSKMASIPVAPLPAPSSSSNTVATTNSAGQTSATRFGTSARSLGPRAAGNRGEYFKGSIVTDDDLVLFSVGLTTDYLALVGIAGSKDFSVESLLTVNTDHLGRAVNSLIMASEMASTSEGSGKGDASTSEGMTRPSQRAVVVSPR